jgi:hypothetical protein
LKKWSGCGGGGAKNFVLFVGKWKKLVMFMAAPFSRKNTQLPWDLWFIFNLKKQKRG